MQVDIFERKLMQYFADRMLPEVSNPLDKFIGYFTLGTLQNNHKKVFEPYEKIGHDLDIIHENEIDIDKLYNSLMYAFNNVPKITVMGFTFNKNDLPLVMSFIKEH